MCLSKVSVRLRRLILTRRSPPEECHILIGLKQNKGTEQSTAVTGINYLLPNGSQTQHSAILVLTLFLLPLFSLIACLSSSPCVGPQWRRIEGFSFPMKFCNYTEILNWGNIFCNAYFLVFQGLCCVGGLSCSSANLEGDKN